MPFDIDCCPSCGTSEFDVRPAIVSPFLAEYLFGRRSELCEIARCRACTLTYFSRRLDDDDVARLYRGYRGPDYFRIRHKHEFWYTRAFNDGLGDDADIRGRRQHLFSA